MRSVALLVLLLVPGAAGVTWLAPEQAYAGHPVEVAWLAADRIDATALANHVEAPMQVWSNGTLVFASESIHEHDGLHALVVTPREPGPLRFEVEVDGTRHEAVVDVLPSERRLEGVAWEDWLDLRLEAEDDRVQVAGYHENGNVHWTHATYLALEDDAGRALAIGAWPAFRDGPAGTVRAWFTAPTDTGYPTPVMGLRTAALAVPEHTQAGGPLLPVPGNTCEGLVLDPPMPEGPLAGYQPWTDLRLSLLTGDEDGEQGPRSDEVTYHVLETTPGAGATLGSYRVGGLTHEMTVRLPGPGTFRIEVQGELFDCAQDIRVVPFGGVDQAAAPPSDAPGQVEASFEVDGADVVGRFAAARDGEAFTHYEFDTWVWREDPADGRLVWRGKLHGHGGPVAFSLHELEPGTYHVRAYPSPQDIDAPPVAAQGDDGFVWSFAIAERAEPAAQESPGPFLLALVLVGMAAWRRRR